VFPSAWCAAASSADNRLPAAQPWAADTHYDTPDRIPTDKPPVAAEGSEQFTRICAAASLPKLGCTTAQNGGSGPSNSPHAVTEAGAGAGWQGAGRGSADTRPGKPSSRWR
jgi:hypothetical protein